MLYARTVWVCIRDVVFLPLQIMWAQWMTARRRLAGARKCLALRRNHQVSTNHCAPCNGVMTPLMGLHHKPRSTLPAKKSRNPRAEFYTECYCVCVTNYSSTYHCNRSRPTAETSVLTIIALSNPAHKVIELYRGGNTLSGKGCTARVVDEAGE